MFNINVMHRYIPMHTYVHSQGHEWRVFTVQKNSALVLFTKGFAKGFLEVLALQGATEKGFWFSNIFFLCSDVTLKACSISVSSAIWFNQHFSKFLLNAGPCAGYGGGWRWKRSMFHGRWTLSCPHRGSSYRRQHQGSCRRGRPCRSGQQPGEVPPVSQAAGQEVRAGGRRGQQLFSLLPAFCYTYLVIDLEIQKRGASNFLLFMAVLVIWGPLKFHMKFRVGFPISAKHVPEIWVEITLSV